MNFWNGVVFLLLASVRNRVLRQIRRLRQPKYLLATACGALYLYTVALRRSAGPGAIALRAGGRSVAELAIVMLGIVTLAGAWIFGGEEGAVQFTEPEVHFLFPAPFTRSTLLRYKLARTLVVTMASAAIMALFAGRRIGAPFGFFFVGAWIGLSTVGLHLIAASMTRASLANHGFSGLRRRVMTVSALVIAVTLLAWGLTRAASIQLASAHGAGHWARTVMDTPPLTWVLFPLRASVRVALAPDRTAFIHSLAPALLVLAAHYLWALNTGVAFEEASADAAERRARQTSARGRGVWRPLRIGRPPFKLRSRGPAFTAILWKNLIAAVRLLSLRLAIVLVVIGVAVAATSAAVIETAGTGRLAMAAVCAIALALYLAVFGPQQFRADLRLDVQHLELLRTLPISGREVVTGAILAPVLVLAAAEISFLALALGLSWSWQLEPFDAGAHIAIAASLAIALPTTTAMGVVAQNAAAIFFSAWVSPERGVGRGMEAMGQRLLTLVGTTLVVVFALAPAAIIALPIAVFATPVLQIYVAPIIAIVVCAIAVAQMYIAVGILGRAFERMDLSSG